MCQCNALASHGTQQISLADHRFPGKQAIIAALGTSRSPLSALAAASPFPVFSTTEILLCSLRDPQGVIVTPFRVRVIFSDLPVAYFWMRPFS